MMWWLIPMAIGAVVAMDHDDRLTAIERSRREDRNVANAPKMIGKRVRCEIDSYEDYDDGPCQEYRCPACSTGLVCHDQSEMVHAPAGKVYTCAVCKHRHAVVETDDMSEPQEIVFKVLGTKKEGA